MTFKVKKTAALGKKCPVLCVDRERAMALVVTAIDMLRNTELRAAKMTLMSARKFHRDNPLLLSLYGYVSYQLDNLTKPKLFFRQCINKKPEFFVPYYCMGMIYESEHDLNNAFKFYGKAYRRLEVEYKQIDFGLDAIRENFLSRTDVFLERLKESNIVPGAVISPDQIFKRHQKCSALEELEQLPFNDYDFQKILRTDARNWKVRADYISFLLISRNPDLAISQYDFLSASCLLDQYDAVEESCRRIKRSLSEISEKERDLLRIKHEKDNPELFDSDLIDDRDLMVSEIREVKVLAKTGEISDTEISDTEETDIESDSESDPDLKLELSPKL